MSSPSRSPADTRASTSSTPTAYTGSAATTRRPVSAAKLAPPAQQSSTHPFRSASDRSNMARYSAAEREVTSMDSVTIRRDATESTGFPSASSAIAPNSILSVGFRFVQARNRWRGYRTIG